MEDIAASANRFYLNRVDGYGKVGASFEAKLLLPLKTLGYGVPPHTFRDYFSMSEQLAKDCTIQFDLAIKELYTEEYLRCPTSTDLKNIATLHEAAHGVEGLLGSLDCSHVYWKNCPVAWQGSYKGKEKKPSIVLEAMCDYNRWFWHASFGYAGTMNDKTIFDQTAPWGEGTDDPNLSNRIECRFGDGCYLYNASIVAPHAPLRQISSIDCTL